MKHILIIVFIALLSTGFVACKNSDTKTNYSTSQTETSGKKQGMISDEMYTCTMHNEVMSDHAGECPKCAMKLVKNKMTEEQQKLMNEGSYTKPKN